MRRDRRQWTGKDFETLRRLAQVHNSDREIAKEMGRRPTAISWQRRRFRIKLATGIGERWNAANRDHRGRFVAPPKPVKHFGESEDRVERLMRLAGCA